MWSFMIAICQWTGNPLYPILVVQQVKLSVTFFYKLIDGWVPRKTNFSFSTVYFKYVGIACMPAQYITIDWNTLSSNFLLKVQGNSLFATKFTQNKSNQNRKQKSLHSTVGVWEWRSFWYTFGILFSQIQHLLWHWKNQTKVRT